ncbi:MAG: hypothetical protein D6736_01535, partial [Nitrospinota bacterium]
EVFVRLEEINKQVERVSEMMAEIAVASEQQNKGVEQISTAMEQMSQVTQQNAASAEASASASEELSSQSEMLRGLVTTFRLTHPDQEGDADHLLSRTGLSSLSPASGNGEESSASRVEACVLEEQGQERQPSIDPERLIPLHEEEDKEILGEF